jgi:5'-methylthioadenosine phosphorylase
MWAIIGGSGFESFPEFKVIENIDLSTPFGSPSSGLKKVELFSTEIIFLSRHGQHHELLPSEINYCANIFALKKLGVSKILSISAAGSLREELHPGDMVIPNQYINYTHKRLSSFCGDGVTGHVSLAKPISHELAFEIEKIKSQFTFPIHFNRTYICIEGPHFSTGAESQKYRTFGADIVGMTNFPEYALAREAGICYLPCAFITDYDAWSDALPHAAWPEIKKVMDENRNKAYAVAKTLIQNTANLLTKGCTEIGLKSGLMCSVDNLPVEKQQWLTVLMNEVGS